MIYFQVQFKFSQFFLFLFSNIFIFLVSHFLSICNCFVLFWHSKARRLLEFVVLSFGILTQTLVTQFLLVSPKCACAMAEKTLRSRWCIALLHLFVRWHMSQFEQKRTFSYFFLYIELTVCRGITSHFCRPYFPSLVFSL